MLYAVECTESDFKKLTEVRKMWSISLPIILPCVDGHLQAMEHLQLFN